MKIEISDIVTAFNIKTIGSKVTNQRVFMDILKDRLENYEKNNFDGDEIDVPGQYLITLPKYAYGCVSSGIGERTQNPEDYVLRRYREGVSIFLKRKEFGLPVESLRVVVYTKEAYLVDPDVEEIEESKIYKSDCTHVLVAILAGSVKTELSPGRFVRNLAGGNLNCSPEHGYTLERAIEDAKKIVNYSNEYMTVAD